MCDHSEEYITFPSATIGGPPGQYLLRCPVPSDASYAEFCIVSFTCLAAGPSSAIVSGLDPQSTIDVSGVSKYSDQAFLRGIFVSAPTNTTIPMTEMWEKITNQLGNIFMLTTGGTSSFITLKYRVKVLTRVPRPFVTVHPSEEAQYGQERARRIEAAVLGKEGELETFGKVPGMPGTTREIETGEAIIKGAQRMFKGRGQ